MRSILGFASVAIAAGISMAAHHPSIHIASDAATDQPKPRNRRQRASAKVTPTRYGKPIYPFSSVRQQERNQRQLAAGQIKFISHGPRAA